MGIRKVLITGVAGQDGSLLAEKLLAEGAEVVGTFRRGSEGNHWRLKELGIQENLTLVEYSSGSNPLELLRLLGGGFTEIYHLAGDSFTADSFRHPFKTIHTNLVGVTELLESIRDTDVDSKIFIASSSEMFGSQPHGKQRVSETSSRNPVNPYGISHSAILDLSKFFRDVYKLSVSTGILFNHESEFRGPQFLSRKITSGLARLKIYGGAPLQLGNLNAKRDWGSAREYVGFFQKILSVAPDDFLICTGKSISVRELFIYCCNKVGFRPEFSGAGTEEICVDSNTGQVLMMVSEKYYRPIETSNLVGDNSKLGHAVGSTPNVSIYDVLHEMCEAENRRLLHNT